MLKWDDNDKDHQLENNCCPEGPNGSSVLIDTETFDALKTLCQLKESDEYLSPAGQAKFLTMAFQHHLYKKIQENTFESDFGLSKKDLDKCLVSSTRDIVVHLVMQQALRNSRVRSSILSVGKSQWEQWCEIYDSVERARAVDRYSSLQHMCDRFCDLYTQACDNMKFCFNPKLEIFSAEHYLPPLDYRELLCLNSLLVGLIAPYGPTELGKTAYAGGIKDPGMDSDLITWIRTFCKNTSPKSAIEMWKTGWQLAKEKATSGSIDSFEPTL